MAVQAAVEVEHHIARMEALGKTAHMVVQAVEAAAHMAELAALVLPPTAPAEALPVAGAETVWRWPEEMEAAAAAVLRTVAAEEAAATEEKAAKAVPARAITMAAEAAAVVATASMVMAETVEAA